MPAFQVQSFEYNDLFGGPGETALNPSELANAEAYMRDYKALGFNTVTLGWGVPFDANGNIAAGFAVNTGAFSGLGEHQASFQELATLDAYAKSIGLQVFLKPQAQTMGGDPNNNNSLPDNLNNYSERNNLNFNVNTFLTAWAGYISQVATFAQQVGAQQLTLGTENGGFDTAAYRSQWQTIIAAAREHYQGPLTYDAPPALDRGPIGVDKVGFWDLLDVIGVSAYYPLTDKASPTYQDVLDGWFANHIYPGNTQPPVNIVQTLQALAVQYGKPVEFNEFGGQSSHGVVNNSAGGGFSNVPDWQQQAWLYQSVIDAFTANNASGWFLGINAWGESLAPPQQSTDFAKYLSSYPTSFDIRAKDAGTVIAAYFGGTDYVSTAIPNFTGSALNDRIAVYANTGVNHAIDGSAGIDALVLNGPASNYTVAATNSGFTVQDKTGADGTSTLTGVERLQFSDGKLALDLAGNAGEVAKVMGAVFGAARPDYVGIGLSLLDGGMPYATAVAVALEAKLSVGYSHAQEVNLLYTNVVGSAPSASDVAYFVGLLDGGALSTADLGLLAADHPLNATHIGLADLAQHGLVYA